MPIKQAGFKALRQAKKRTVTNTFVKDTVDFLIHRSLKLIKAKKVAEAKEHVAKAIKALDKAAGKGILKKNTAARNKSRLMIKLNALVKEGKK